MILRRHGSLISRTYIHVYYLSYDDHMIFQYLSPTYGGYCLHDISLIILKEDSLVNMFRLNLPQHSVSFQQFCDSYLSQKKIDVCYTNRQFFKKKFKQYFSLMLKTNDIQNVDAHNGNDLEKQSCILYQWCFSFLYRMQCIVLIPSQMRVTIVIQIINLYFIGLFWVYHIRLLKHF